MCTRREFTAPVLSLVRCCALLGWLLTGVGCGTTRQNLATEQILNSDAVDGAVAKIDFTPLEGQRVYFDTQYMKDYNGIGFVNASYVISSIRQQMMAAGLLLQEDKDKAEFVLEGRIGTLGTDNHEVVYGIPSSNGLNAAASVAASAAGAPGVTGIPELAWARRHEQVAAAKIGVFAYERKSREAVWQSGTSVALATQKNMWVFGVGPFQKGSITGDKMKFDTNSLTDPTLNQREGIAGPIAAYRKEAIFRHPEPTHPQYWMDGVGNPDAVQPAGLERLPAPARAKKAP